MQYQHWLKSMEPIDGVKSVKECWIILDLLEEQVNNVDKGTCIYDKIDGIII